MRTSRIRQFLYEFDLEELLRDEPGPDNFRARPLRLQVAGQTFILQPLAQRRGFPLFECVADPLPARAARIQIERELAKIHEEHLLVFTDAARKLQKWQWARRERKAPLRLFEESYTVGAANTRLAQKLYALKASLEAEKRLAVAGAAGRARRAGNLERMTRRFYERFRRERETFLKLITGIPDRREREWYASLMLNRLMFVYFLQKKGFLDGDADYLRHRLALGQKRHGADGFHSYYKTFLLRLFHEGLGGRKRSPELIALLGRVPYLNGGLFDRHQLERDQSKISIPDRAFARLFDFFDEYEWRLDDRSLCDDCEINPDVLGHIFEKYINQKQMGAYYTKEDITEYISRNTIIPALLDRAARACANAFHPTAGVWQLLSDNPDRYIYAAVRHGVVNRDGEVSDLPPGIVAGRDDAGERGQWWSRAAPKEFGLPTETWREYAARRRRCLELREKLARGEVTQVNDLVTFNLDLRQFAQDVIATTESADLLGAFYHALVGRAPEKSDEHDEPGLSVLDPTCGSGAFLLAALDVLQPLLGACLDRMEIFVADADRAGRAEAHAPFRRTLAEIENHPNRGYFILKSIIIGNLYGVDIMEEATELCKLRLFLKLVAEVEREDAKPNAGLEPLPDIDFNIRAGNTLVGFVAEASVADVTDGEGQGRFDDNERKAQLRGQARATARAFELFRRQQTHLSGAVAPEDKAELRRRLNKLSDQLDLSLAYANGVDAERGSKFREWRKSHQPFHWFTEFYGIIRQGGFDVIIGNPPYLSAAKVRRQYALTNYVTSVCSDIYANVLERSAGLLKDDGRSGMIVPLSLTFSGDFAVLRHLLFERWAENWFSSFARIPAALFSAEVRVRNTIHLGHKSKAPPRTYTTVLHRWFEPARPFLFSNLSYARFSPAPYKGLIPKINTTALAAALERHLAETQTTLASCFAPGKTEHRLHYKKSAYNWLCFCRKLPPCFDSNGRAIEQTKFGTVYFTNSELRDLAFLFLNGKLMFAYWGMIGDDFDVTRWMFANFPIDLCALPLEARKKLLSVCNELEEAMAENVSFKINAGKKVGNYNLAKCRHVTDKADAIFANHLQLQGLQREVELMYAQLVRTHFDDAEHECLGIEPRSPAI